MNEIRKEHWFVAILVFESSIHGGEDVPRSEKVESSVDLQFRVVRASDYAVAYERALAIGNREQASYKNRYGETCVWSFKGMKDLREVSDDELADGVEVYGFIIEGKAEDHVISEERLLDPLRGVDSDEEETR